MKNAVISILSLLFLLAPAAQATELGTAKAQQKANATDDPAPAATYDVFIDGVTGYAFVKTPFGWKFVRDLRAEPATDKAVSQ